MKDTIFKLTKSQFRQKNKDDSKFCFYFTLSSFWSRIQKSVIQFRIIMVSNQKRLICERQKLTVYINNVEFCASKMRFCGHKIKEFGKTKVRELLHNN